MTFKDASNRGCNQTALPRTHGAPSWSNLCTEILEVTSAGETAVCNLGSINLSRHTLVEAGKVSVDWEKLARTVCVAVRQLEPGDRPELLPDPVHADVEREVAPRGPRGDGASGRLFPDAPPVPMRPEAVRAISEAGSPKEVYFRALTASSDLAVRKGRNPSFSGRTRARGELQFDAWGITPDDPRPLGCSCVRAWKETGLPQFAARRDRPHGDDRVVDRRLLRVHRSRKSRGRRLLQARDVVRRLPAGEPAFWSPS